MEIATGQREEEYEATPDEAIAALGLLAPPSREPRRMRQWPHVSHPVALGRARRRGLDPARSERDPYLRGRGPRLRVLVRPDIDPAEDRSILGVRCRRSRLHGGGRAACLRHSDDLVAALGDVPAVFG